MDRENCTCGEESRSWESQSVTLYGVFHTWCINGFVIMSLMRLSLLRETPPPSRRRNVLIKYLWGSGDGDEGG